MGEQSIELRDFCLGCGAEMRILDERKVHRCDACAKRYKPKVVVTEDVIRTIDQLSNRTGIQNYTRRNKDAD